MSKAVAAVGAGFVQRSVSGLAAMWLVLVAGAFLAVPPSFSQTADSQTADLADSPAAAPTSTELSVTTDDTGSRTHARFTVRVTGDQVGVGAVTLSETRGTIGSAALGADGGATFDVDGLRPGENRIVATYAGTDKTSPSTSPAVMVNAFATGIPDYSLSLSPASLTVKAGTDGTVIASVAPSNGFAQLVSLSCAGNSVPLPVGVSCLFTPVNLVPATTGAALTSSLNIQTTGVAGKTSVEPSNFPQSHPADRFYAILLPGILALTALGASRRRTLSAFRLLSLAALLIISGLALSSCAARYHYLHNPPAANNGTPAGTYTLVITASSTQGSTTIVHSQNIALTVN